MSQHKLTDNELNTFARYLWEHGDKRKLEAFRATFPDSRASNATASNQADKIWQQHSPDILPIIEKLHEEAAKETLSLGIDIKEKIRYCRNLMGRGSKAVEEEGSGTKFPPGEVDRHARTGLMALQEINKLDGSYAPAKIENLTPITSITETIVYPKNHAS